MIDKRAIAIPDWLPLKSAGRANLKLSKPDRLRLLLKSLDRLTWREAPSKVGLKTAVQARDQGYIELTVEPQRRYLCRLTAHGQTLKRRLIAMERAKADLAIALNKKPEEV